MRSARRTVEKRCETRIVVAPRVYAPRFYYGGYYGYRPGYRPYAFRPWTRLSFGVFVGHEATNLSNEGPYTCCADHLEEQLYPSSVWGKNYAIVRAQERSAFCGPR